MCLDLAGCNIYSKINIVKALIRLVALISIFLSACSQEALYSGLTESEANEMIALLYTGGFKANKRSVREQGKSGTSYYVAIKSDALPLATALLKANGLPRHRFDSFPEIFPKLMSQSPVEQMALLKHGLAQEMANTLSTIDGVSVARVHLTLPDRATRSQPDSGSSAAVFIKHRADVNLESSVTKIKSLVVDGVEKMDYDDVTVVFFEDKPVVVPVIAAAKNQPPSASFDLTSTSWRYFLMFWLLFLVCALIGYIRRARNSNSRPKLSLIKR